MCGWIDMTSLCSNVRLVQTTHVTCLFPVQSNHRSPHLSATAFSSSTRNSRAPYSLPLNVNQTAVVITLKSNCWTIPVLVTFTGIVSYVWEIQPQVWCLCRRYIHSLKLQHGQPSHEGRSKLTDTARWQHLNCSPKQRTCSNVQSLKPHAVAVKIKIKTAAAQKYSARIKKVKLSP
jgi:hypothetical protein